jgi:ectoine hydroxylase-related dioxygenase (phytanoyl-CoA dioxygenase family)
MPPNLGGARDRTYIRMAKTNQNVIDADARLFHASAWRTLSASLTLSDSLVLSAIQQASGADVKEKFYKDISTEGYAITHCIVGEPERSAMVRGIDEIRARNFSPIWALMYDEFWEMYAQFSSIAGHVLGENYRHVTGNYAFVVENSDSAAGWGVHRDMPYASSLRDDGSPKIMSFWVALTDATPLNSCLYCVPASRDVNYPDNLASVEIPRVEDIECMAIRAGHAIGLNHSLLHWGSRSSRRGSDRRISVVFDLQRGDCERYHHATIDVRDPLSFEQRAAYVAHNVLWLRKYWICPRTSGHGFTLKLMKPPGA